MRRPDPRAGRGPRAVVPLFILCTLSCGCTVETEPPRGPSGPRLHPVSGRVTLDGRPLAGATVVFLPSFSDRGVHCTGETDASGRFELKTLNSPGAASGDYRVAVSLLVTPDGTLVDAAMRSADVVGPEMLVAKERIPARYSDLSQTELRATVSGPTPSLEFDLQGPLLDVAPARPSPTPRSQIAPPASPEPPGA